MTTVKQPKVVVIGAGPGGYPAAIKAARLGAAVTIVEKNGFGGTCLHRGCIPTKYLLKSAKEYQHLGQACSRWGAAPPPPVDLKELMKKKSGIVRQLSSGTASLLKANGVKAISGTATFKDARTVTIQESGETLTADTFILATGSGSIALPIDGADLPGVLDSDRILELEALPQSLAVIGGSYIGLEFAQVFAMLGVAVTVIEMMPQIMPTEDADIAKGIATALSQSGITIHTGAKVSAFRSADGQLNVAFEKGGEQLEVTADKVLVAVGRRAYFEGLGLKRIGVQLAPDGTVAVNRKFETNRPGIYAIGDLICGPMLAHKATAEGELVAHYAVGETREVATPIIPSVMYTHPQVARVGMTEAEAKEKYGSLLVGRFPFLANGRAVLEGETKGFVKVIAEPKYETIVGAAIVGPQADNMIQEAALAIQMEASLEDVAETVHAHPTLSEAFKEAVLDATGEAIHIPPRKKRR